MKATKLFFTVLLPLGIFLSYSGTNEKNDPTLKKPNTKTLIAPNESLSNTGQWVPLFNGRDLEGWEVKSVKEDQHYNFWSVKDGAIVVNSMGVTDHDYNWLQTKKEYADFELKLKFQSYRESPGNSGIQIRSRYDSDGTAKGSVYKGWLDGPQVDIHPKKPWRTGFIYDETRGHQRWIYPDLPDWNIDKSTYAPKEVRHYFNDEPPHWNDLVIICKGNHITTIVNNLIVADYDGKGVLDDRWHQKYGVDTKGFIALQLHKNNQLKMAFKDIQIKAL
ncbi:DUF1080 domain-containing protein [Maribacter polysiphoniae]|uniref:DUF1080 domain-containing protein n=1 Tax=Maribacter polysiphoniae TaxID=429344 RepID=A0A316DXR4_9FLAO|nr:DUF1080 domain-containing protein [Maribacter polysiphoniae]MBD1261530.1 DUF1080 domain-containing protein [Maribacter polysiphoniae]PWK22864.1 uncharacterized protein DUF1080 [Maribacter polysiphoniae]